MKNCRDRATDIAAMSYKDSISLQNDFHCGPDLFILFLKAPCQPKFNIM